MVKLRECGGKAVEMLRQNGTSDFDNGELRRGYGAELGEVLLDLSFRADTAEEAHYRRPSGVLRLCCSILTFY